MSVNIRKDIDNQSYLLKEQNPKNTKTPKYRYFMNAMFQHEDEMIDKEFIETFRSVGYDMSRISDKMIMKRDKFLDEKLSIYHKNRNVERWLELISWAYVPGN